jgi:hypothetical protein
MAVLLYCTKKLITTSMATPECVVVVHLSDHVCLVSSLGLLCAALLIILMCEPFNSGSSGPV